jgi:hypothetical protein
VLFILYKNIRLTKYEHFYHSLSGDIISQFQVALLPAGSKNYNIEKVSMTQWFRANE